MTPRALRRRLDDLTREAGSQRALARRLGVHEATVSCARAGRLTHLDLVAERLGLLPAGDPESRTYARAPAMTAVAPDAVLALLRAAVAAAGSQTAYAVRCGSVGLQSHVSKVIRGVMAPMECLLSPIGVRRVGGQWMCPAA